MAVTGFDSPDRVHVWFSYDWGDASLLHSPVRQGKQQQRSVKSCRKLIVYRNYLGVMWVEPLSCSAHIHEEWENKHKNKQNHSFFFSSSFIATCGNSHISMCTITALNLSQIWMAGGVNKQTTVTFFPLIILVVLYQQLSLRHSFMQNIILVALYYSSITNWEHQDPSFIQDFTL